MDPVDIINTRTGKVVGQVMFDDEHDIIGLGGVDFVLRGKMDYPESENEDDPIKMVHYELIEESWKNNPSLVEIIRERDAEIRTLSDGVVVLRRQRVTWYKQGYKDAQIGAPNKFGG